MTENRTYSEADLAALRKEWEQERSQNDLVKQVAAIQGQLGSLPATMESIARRVVAEVIADQHKQNAEQRAQRSEQRSERTWGRAPVVIQLGQLFATVALTVLAYFAGKGHIP